MSALEIHYKNIIANVDVRQTFPSQKHTMAKSNFSFCQDHFPLFAFCAHFVLIFLFVLTYQPRFLPVKQLIKLKWPNADISNSQVFL